MLVWLTLLAWLFFGWLAHSLAQKKGFNPTLWFFLGLGFGLLTILLLLLLPKKQPEQPPPTTPTPETDPSYFDWFYLNQENKHLGPHKLKQLLPIWNEGVLSPHSYVWSEGMDSWKKIDQIPKLHEFLRNIG